MLRLVLAIALAAFAAAPVLAYEPIKIYEQLLGKTFRGGGEGPNGESG